MNNTSEKIIDVENLKVKFRNADNRKKTTDIIRDVSFSVRKGEIVGFIGESGSGKSVTAKSLFGMNLNSITTANKFEVSGVSMIQKDDKVTTSNKDWRAIRGNHVAYIPQNPMTSLNPTMKIGKQLIEPLKLHGQEVVNSNVELKKEELKNLKSELTEIVLSNISLVIAKKIVKLINNKKSNAEDLKAIKKSKEFGLLNFVTDLNKKFVLNINALISSFNKKDTEKYEKAAEFFKTWKYDGLTNKELIGISPQDTLKKFNELGECKTWIKDPYKSYVGDILEEFGIVDARNRLNSYPHEFSGGMKQRVVIAMAILAQPDLIIADEPTTALDPTIQASVLKLFGDIVKKYNVGVIFVSHDISVISTLCTYVNVFYAGRIIERANKFDLFTNPQHPYTWALLSSMPELSDGGELYTLDGAPPNFAQLPSGDAFSPRNKYAMEIDFREEAPLFKVEKDNNHYAATWLLHPSAPKVTPPAQVKTVAAQIRKDIKDNGKK